MPGHEASALHVGAFTTRGRTSPLGWGAQALLLLCGKVAPYLLYISFLSSYPSILYPLQPLGVGQSESSESVERSHIPKGHSSAKRLHSGDIQGVEDQAR